ncbi:hypothetical protein MPSEU_000264900 [Mayamaea pseudoterrestris]|nr:hypothetical protein MPSEU_000264900 [Mayamaea pseudoterrestris]
MAVYDLAFGYRDFGEEVSFLLQAHVDACSSSSFDTVNVLELAAGPARHALEALQNDQVASVACVDLSSEMKAYAQQLYEEQGGDKDSSRFAYHLADMRKFDMKTLSSISSSSSSSQFDTAWLLLGSLQHLTTNQEVIDCFSCIHQALRPGGTLILELPHPRELFGMVDCTRNEWTVPLSGEYDEDDNDDDEEEEEEDNASDSSDDDKDEYQIIWGDEDDEFDPIRQVRQATVNVQRKNGGGNMESNLANDHNLPSSIRQIVPLRLFTAQEIDLFARCTGFSVAAMHGALQDDVTIDNDEEAFRLVCVLRKQ